MLKEELLTEIERQNRETKKLLGIDDFSKEIRKKFIDKIVDSNIIKYKSEFLISPDNIDYDKYLEYVYDISNYIEEDILNNDEITRDSIEGLHKNIFKIFPEKISGKLRTSFKMTYNLDENGKLENRDYFISENKVKKLFEKSLVDLNKDMSFENIVYFFQLNISKIHPFDDGNGRTFFILLDSLLVKYNYLPIFIMQDKKEYNIITEKYFVDRNFKLLNLAFLNLILNKYKNYHIK